MYEIANMIIQLKRKERLLLLTWTILYLDITTSNTVKKQFLIREVGPYGTFFTIIITDTGAVAVNNIKLKKT